jgi:hypothetical protein
MAKPFVPPTALSMIICDHVWRDPCEGKCTIIGTFSKLNADAVPFVHPIIAIYLALTGGHGDVKIRTRLVDVDEQFPPVFRTETAITFTDPCEVQEFAIELPNVPIPRAGEHRLQLFSNDEFLLERRLDICLRLKRNQPGRPFE